MSITISWDAVRNAANYTIYRSDSGSSTYTQVGSSSTTSYTNTGLTGGTTYYYKVAVSYPAIGLQSDYASATTIFNAPTGVSATTGVSSGITISWDVVQNAASYTIYRSDSSSGTYTQIGSSSTTSYTDMSVTKTKVYYYRVAVSNTGLQSAPVPGYAYWSYTSINLLPMAVGTT